MSSRVLTMVGAVIALGCGGLGGSPDEARLIPDCVGGLGDAAQCDCLEQEAQARLSPDVIDHLRNQSPAEALTDGQAAELSVFFRAVAASCEL